MYRHGRAFRTALSLCLLVPCTARTQAAGEHHVARRINTGGEGGWARMSADTVAPGQFKVAMVPTVRGSRTMALDKGTHRVYLSSASYGPTPAPTADRPRPRPPMIPGSFTVLVLER